MPPVVIDHNILFAALRSRDSHTRRKLLEAPFQFYTPNYLVVELFKHRPRIVAKSNASEEEILVYLTKITSKLHFFSEEHISTGNFIEAYRLCNDVDENDTTYVALTLELSGLLWTRDEELKSGLRRKGFDRFLDESLLNA